MPNRLEYAYKSIEISIKTQISTAYPNVSLKELYKWEAIKEFLNTKRIDFTTFKEYKTVNVIRMINNDIKHSSKISASVIKQNITEFSGLEYYSSDSLKSYYVRIKNSSVQFVNSLARELINELYMFNDNRLDEIVNDMTKRMNKETISKFVDKLKQKIKC